MDFRRNFVLDEKSVAWLDKQKNMSDAVRDVIHKHIELDDQTPTIENLKTKIKETDSQIRLDRRKLASLQDQLIAQLKERNAKASKEEKEKLKDLEAAKKRSETEADKRTAPVANIPNLKTILDNNPQGDVPTDLYGEAVFDACLDNPESAEYCKTHRVGVIQIRHFLKGAKK